MLRSFMRAKIHRAVVTQADVDYVGSITLDPLLMRAAGLLPMEQVDVLNCVNGSRLTTYCLEGREGSGEVGLNGAAALLCRPKDIILVVGYTHLDAAEIPAFESRTVLLGPGNRVHKVLRIKAAFTGRAADAGRSLSVQAPKRSRPAKAARRAVSGARKTRKQGAKTR